MISSIELLISTGKPHQHRSSAIGKTQVLGQFIKGLSGDETTRRLGVGDSTEEVLVEGREEGAGVSPVEGFDCWVEDWAETGRARREM